MLGVIIDIVTGSQIMDIQNANLEAIQMSKGRGITFHVGAVKLHNVISMQKKERIFLIFICINTNPESNHINMGKTDIRLTPNHLGR